MYATYQEKEIGYELQVQSYFYRLLYLMVTKYRKMNVSGEIVREHRNRNRLSSITGYIKENFKEDLSLEGVAQSFGYSPTYLSTFSNSFSDPLISVSDETHWVLLRIFSEMLLQMPFHLQIHYALRSLLPMHHFR